MSRSLLSSFKFFQLSLREFQRELGHKWDLNSMRNGFSILGRWLAKECSPIVAQRVRRSYQVLQVHSKLWSSLASPKTNSQHWFLGLLLVSLCEQNNNSSYITNQELTQHMDDLNYIKELTAATVVCPHCKDRLVVDKKVPNVKYCHCPQSSSVYNRKIDGYPWIPFVETPDLLIWRKPHDTNPGLFVYKVYGYYNDITPADFLETQLDLDYRKKWDSTVLTLDIIESGEDKKEEVVYWVMQWPRMFSNRDYVFARRHLINEKDGMIVIMNKALTHDKAPEKSGIVRVKEYWSVMHIQAVNGLDKNGVEFGLTYYDNPGLSLPGWLLNWASMTAIPEFLNKLRDATRVRRKQGIKKYLKCRDVNLNSNATLNNESSGTTTSTNKNSSESSSIALTSNKSNAPTTTTTTAPTAILC